MKRYESPCVELISEATDSILVSIDLKDLFAIELWDMLLSGE